jgi:hypothetical protein
MRVMPEAHMIQNYRGAVISITQQRKHVVKVGWFTTTVEEHAGNGSFFQLQVSYRGYSGSGEFESEMEALRKAKAWVDNKINKGL